MEMALRLSAGPRSNLLAVVENAFRANEPQADPMHIPSEPRAVWGESRLETLKKKAALNSRSTSDVFANCTNRTTSIEDAAQLLSAVTNVDLLVRVPAHI